MTAAHPASVQVLSGSIESESVTLPLMLFGAVWKEIFADFVTT